MQCDTLTKFDDSSVGKNIEKCKHGHQAVACDYLWKKSGTSGRYFILYSI